MLKICLAEDLPSERETMEQYLHRYALEHHTELDLKSYADGKDLLREYVPDTDLILLDIDMKYLNGLDTAREIRKQDEQVTIVFITRMVQHALEGYEVQAADYIVKPVNYTLFAAKIDRIVSRISSAMKKSLILKTEAGQIIIFCRDILYAETEGRHILIHKQDHTVLNISKPLYQLEQDLPNEMFFRCHSAYLINLQHVTGYSQTDVFLDKTSIPLSKHRRRDFIDALMNYHALRI